MKKNILYSMDYMYGCREELEKELNKMFNVVRYIDHYLPPKSMRTVYFKMLREIYNFFPQNKILKKLFDDIVRNYYLKNVLNFSEKMDYFFVVAGQEFSKEFIQDLKIKNKEIKTIIFLWDKLEYTSLKNIVFEFDYVFSFDRDDCEKYGFIFRPFFYLENFSEKVGYFNRKYDLSYIGALRDKKRYIFIEKIYKLSQKYSLKEFLKLVHVEKKRDKFIRIYDFISNKKISPEDNLNLLKESRVICEIPFKEQVGLTLRALQSLYFENKIITTNKDIKKYDFYNEKNVKVIYSLEEIEKIEREFFSEEYQKVDESILKKYNVSSFLNEIFIKVK